MNKPWELNADKVLVFSDVHQHIDWVQAVLEREAGNFDTLLFNGDIIDSLQKPPAVAPVKETAQFYAWLIDNYHVNLGNHEIAIRESWYHNSKFQKKKALINGCAGFTNSKSLKFNRQMTLERWQKTTLFRVVNGWLVSHAGFRENFFRPFMSVDENFAALWKDATEALDNLAFQSNPLFRIGYARSGSKRDTTWGGPLWLDWNHEFEDNLPVSQLVGHTHEFDSVRKIGNSYNIDTAVTYAFIYRDGSIEFKSLKYLETRDSQGNKIWVNDTPKIRDESLKPVARFVTTNENLLPSKGYIY